MMTLYPNTQNPIYLYQETAPGMRGGMMFTLNTDAQGQTADRVFTLQSSFGATGGGQFN